MIVFEIKSVILVSNTEHTADGVETLRCCHAGAVVSDSGQRRLDQKFLGETMMTKQSSSITNDQSQTMRISQGMCQIKLLGVVKATW
jgi:hypothetical protein